MAPEGTVLAAGGELLSVLLALEIVCSNTKGPWTMSPLVK